METPVRLERLVRLGLNSNCLNAICATGKLSGNTQMADCGAVDVQGRKPSRRTTLLQLQSLKVGTQPAVVRFMRHNNPTRWASNVGKSVEFQTCDDKQVHHGVVDRVINGIPFIVL